MWGRRGWGQAAVQSVVKQEVSRPLEVDTRDQPQPNCAGRLRQALHVKSSRRSLWRMGVMLIAELGINLIAQAGATRGTGHSTPH
jgi:hypothetical protein